LGNKLAANTHLKQSKSIRQLPVLNVKGISCSYPFPVSLPTLFLRLSYDRGLEFLM